MAFQQGRLQHDEILAGALPEAANLLDNAVRNSMPEIPFVSGYIVSLMYDRYPDAMLRHTLKLAGASAHEMLMSEYGLAESTGLPLYEINWANLSASSLQILLGDVNRPKSAPSAVAVSPNQCSTFAAWGKQTKKGEVIIGRNTDFALNGTYDLYPTVFYYEPSDGSQRYMTVASAGVAAPGVMGYNDAGIYLAVHTVPTTDVSTKGMPVFAVGEQVLRHAQNLDEAVSLIQLAKPEAGWSYLIVSAQEKKGAVVDMSNSKKAVRMAEGDYEVQTNHFLTPALKDSYLHLNRASVEDSHGRYARIEGLLRHFRGELDERSAISILGDQWDPIRGKIQGVGSTIAKPITVTSVVLKPEAGKIYVANGVAPVSQRSYVELPLVESFDPEKFAGEKYKVYDASWFQKDYPAQAQAEQKFIQAKIAFDSKREPRRAHALLREAIGLDRDNPSYYFVSGILALKAGMNSDAKADLTALLTMPYRHYWFLARYYLGRIYGAEGNQSLARENFNAIVRNLTDGEEIKLRAAVAHSLLLLSRSEEGYPLDTSYLSLMMQEGDMVQYTEKE